MATRPRSRRSSRPSRYIARLNYLRSAEGVRSSLLRRLFFMLRSGYNEDILGFPARREVPMIVLKDVLALLNGELLTPGSPLEVACPKVFASDLMSDVLTSADPGSPLLTGLANPHVVCTCSVADLAAVV